jgi:SAM-dependent methyltransferase
MLGEGGSMHYRDRIYRDYLTARHESVAPQTIEAFAPRAPYLRRVIRDHFPPDKASRILELGCGHGIFIHFIREAGYANVTGVDRSPEQVAVAKKLRIEGVIGGDIMATLSGMPDACLDVLIAHDVIEHLTQNEAVALADHANRVLAPNGLFVLHTINADSPFFGAIRYGDFTHEMAYNRASMGQLLMSSGFTRVDCFEDAPIAHGLTSTVRLLLWKVLRSGLRLFNAVETGDIGRNAVLTRNFLTVATK